MKTKKVVETTVEGRREDHMVFLCDFIRQLLMDHGCIRNYYGGGE